MIKRYVVRGHSMEPFFKEGDRLLIFSKFFRIGAGDVIVFREGNTDFLKRVVSIDDGKYSALGDNEGHGKKFVVERKNIIGKYWRKY